MSEYTPTTEDIREYVEVGGEPRPWIAPSEEENAMDASRAAAFDRWLAAHDAEVRAAVLPSREAIADAIQGITGLWDEPLDEVHDIPPIVNAVLALLAKGQDT